MSGSRLETSLVQYPKSWDLALSGPINGSKNSLLVPVETAFGPAMLKQAPKGTTLTASSGLLRWYEGSGSAHIFKKQKNTQLIEWIDGPALSNLVKKDKDEQAIDILSDMVHKLHAPKKQPLKTRLVSLHATMQPLLAQKFSDNLIHRHGARLIRHLLETTPKQSPLHGNLHFDKVMHHSDRGWLTIAPKGLVGDPHYELASALCHPNGQPNLHQVRKRIKSRSTRFANNLSLSKDRLLTFAFCHACLMHLQAEKKSENSNYWNEISTIMLDSLVD